MLVGESIVTKLSWSTPMLWPSSWANVAEPEPVQAGEFTVLYALSANPLLSVDIR